MATVLSIVQQASIEIGIARPTALYGQTDRTSYDVQNILNKTVDMLREAHDWQRLMAICTYTGDDVTDGFDLPTDYFKMAQTAALWSSRYLWKMEQVTDIDQWLEMIVRPYTLVNGSWIIYGNQVNIKDTMATGDTAKFFYMKNTICADSMGGGKSAFTADDDVFLIDDELLRLGFLTNWKAEKGRDYAQNMADYERKLVQVINRDAGSKPILSGRPFTRWNQSNVAWPGAVVVTP